jgi:glycosyltransferase involved in cell wall biosynthesis
VRRGGASDRDTFHSGWSFPHMSSNGVRRTAWVITECYPRPGSLQHCVFAHRQLLGLDNSGWRPRVLIPGPSFPALAWPIVPRWRRARKRAIPRGWSHQGIPVSTLFYANPIPNRLANGNVGELVLRELDAQLARVSPEERPSVLVCQFALPFGPMVRTAALKHKRPYVVVLRGDDVWIWPHHDADRLRGFIDTVRDAALVLAVSEALLDEARRVSGLSLTTAAVLPNGVELERLRPASVEARARARAELGFPASAFVVLCVGAAIARKGWGELLDAIGSMDDPGIAVLAASLGPDELDLETEQRRRCPQNVLVLRENLPTSDLALLYTAADAFCLPTHGEGMSNALLEAMAAGLPVVTTPVGGHPEIVTPGVEGFLVPPRSVEELAHALRLLRDDRELRARMGGAARSRVEKVGTPADNGRRLARLLDAIADQTLPQVIMHRNPYQSLLGATA